MRLSKIQEWQNNLKKGDRIRVLYNHCEVYGVFLKWTSSSKESCHYINMTWWGHPNPKDYLDASKIYRIDHINSNGRSRVKPVDESYLEQEHIECFDNIKNLILK